MQIGKVSQTVLKRSILKPLQFQREEAFFPPSAEEMCYGIRTGENEQCLSSSAVLYGNEKDLGVFALAQVVNDLASRGATPKGVGVQIILPPYAYESRLKAMTEHIERAAASHKIQVLSARAEVSPAVTMAVVTVNGIGTFYPGDLLRSNMAMADQDIVLLKWIGLEGTFRAMREKETLLSRRFTPSFLGEIKKLEPEIFSEREILLAREQGASAIHQITGGGILSALWEMAESGKLGLEVDLKKMTIRQETVEICEFCHLNPYQLTSAGSMLIVTPDGEGLTARLQEEGLAASLLGRTTSEKARVILGGEEKRFLDRPAPDELLRLYEKEEDIYEDRNSEIH